MFVTRETTNQLIYCNINKKIKSLSNYLLIKTILNFKTQTKFIHYFRRNKKFINIKKFNNILKRLLLKLLLDVTIKQKSINKYTIALLEILKKIIENFIL